MIKMLRGVSYVPEGVPVYIFGAGKAGQILVDELKRKPSIRLLGVIDNFKTGDIKGVPIKSAANFLQDNPVDALVIIASMYVDEIAEQLSQGACKNIYNGHPLAMALMDRKALRRTAAVAAAFLALLSGVLWLLLS